MMCLIAAMTTYMKLCSRAGVTLVAAAGERTVVDLPTTAVTRVADDVRSLLSKFGLREFDSAALGAVDATKRNEKLINGIVDIRNSYDDDEVCVVGVHILLVDCAR
jgi:hypothetical protein